MGNPAHMDDGNSEEAQSELYSVEEPKISEMFQLSLQRVMRKMGGVYGVNELEVLGEAFGWEREEVVERSGGEIRDGGDAERNFGGVGNGVANSGS